MADRTNAERKRAMRERRVAAGMCPGCGKNPAPPGTNCQACRDRNRIAVQRHRSAPQAV